MRSQMCIASYFQIQGVREFLQPNVRESILLKWYQTPSVERKEPLLLAYQS